MGTVKKAGALGYGGGNTKCQNSKNNTQICFPWGIAAHGRVQKMFFHLHVLSVLYIDYIYVHPQENQPQKQIQESLESICLVNGGYIDNGIVLNLKAPDGMSGNTVLGQIPLIVNTGDIVRRAAADKIPVYIFIVAGGKVL